MKKRSALNRSLITFLGKEDDKWISQRKGTYYMGAYKDGKLYLFWYVRKHEKTKEDYRKTKPSYIEVWMPNGDVYTRGKVSSGNDPQNMQHHWEKNKSVLFNVFKETHQTTFPEKGSTAAKFLDYYIRQYQDNIGRDIFKHIRQLVSSNPYQVLDLTDYQLALKLMLKHKDTVDFKTYISESRLTLIPLCKKKYTNSIINFLKKEEMPVTWTNICRESEIRQTVDFKLLNKNPKMYELLQSNPNLFALIKGFVEYQHFYKEHNNIPKKLKNICREKQATIIRKLYGSEELTQTKANQIIAFLKRDKSLKMYILLKNQSYNLLDSLCHSNILNQIHTVCKPSDFLEFLSRYVNKRGVYEDNICLLQKYEISVFKTKELGKLADLISDTHGMYHGRFQHDEVFLRPNMPERFYTFGQVERFHDLLSNALRNIVKNKIKPMQFKSCAQPIPAPSFLTPLDSGLDLIDEGDKMHNCLSSYTKSLYNVNSFFYHIETVEEKGTVKISRIFENHLSKYQRDDISKGTWQVDQAYAACNQDLSKPLIQKINQWIESLNSER